MQNTFSQCYKNDQQKIDTHIEYLAIININIIFN